MPTPARPLLLTLQGSPRRRGNTARLASAFAHACPEYRSRSIFLFGETLLPCRGCNACQNRACPIRDAVPRVQAAIASADALLIASPVFFYGFPSHVKALIDRSQPWWHHPPQRKHRPAFLLATCGSENAREFEVIAREAKAFLNTAGFTLTGQLLVSHLESKNRAALLQKAQAQAMNLARA